VGAALADAAPASAAASAITTIGSFDTSITSAGLRVVLQSTTFAASSAAG
jgi:hypothetical protein